MNEISVAGLHLATLMFGRALELEFTEVLRLRFLDLAQYQGPRLSVSLDRVIPSDE